MKHKRLLRIDFDGVMHSYTSAWAGTRVICDPPVEGAFEWLRSVIDAETEEGEPAFGACIYSSRSKDPKAVDAMRSFRCMRERDSRNSASVSRSSTLRCGRP